MRAGVVPSVFGLLGFLLVTVGGAVTIADTPLALSGVELVVLGVFSWALAAGLYLAPTRR